MKTGDKNDRPIEPMQIVEVASGPMRDAYLPLFLLSLGNLAFYQRLGFRLLSIERDYFGPDKGYGSDCVDNGIAVRDLVWLDRELQGSVNE